MSRSTPELLREALVHLEPASEMRNRIAHGYLLLDADIVTQTIEIDLPDIVRNVERELSGTRPSRSG
ncbi:MAG: HepT-like ribonuclease domain-containing protein [Phycicoccus sp.]